MTAIEVAKSAIESTLKFRGILSEDIRRELAYAQITHWLNQQDEEVLHAAAKTATAAAACVGAMFNS